MSDCLVPASKLPRSLCNPTTSIRVPSSSSLTFACRVCSEFLLARFSTSSRSVWAIASTTLPFVRITRALFASGYFNDIKIARDGSVLIVTMAERPAIESIELDGNKAIETDALLEGLADQGLQEGEIFKRGNSLERMGLELERQYVAQGRYGASINTEIEDLPRNQSQP